MRLDGKIAAITGAGSGFGKGIAYKFSQEGANVILADLNNELVENVSKDLNQDWLYVDVSKSDSMKNLSDYILEYSIPFVDSKVYNKTQCLRMKGCCIRNRPETMLISNSSFQDTLTTNINSKTKHLCIHPINQKCE